MGKGRLRQTKQPNKKHASFAQLDPGSKSTSAVRGVEWCVVVGACSQEAQPKQP